MKKIISNITSIELKSRFEGQGLVNSDSSEQSYFLGKAGIFNTKNNNNTFSKKIFKSFENENGKVETKYKVKVSSEFLRHNIFVSGMPYELPQLAGNPVTLAMMCGMLQDRGYLFPLGKGKNTLKKASTLSMSDAVSDGPWLSHISMDFHSKTGCKNEEQLIPLESVVDSKETSDSKDDKKSKNDDSSTTLLHNTENVGKLIYESSGYIDLEEMQFTSLDPLYDRMSIDRTNGAALKMFIETLKKMYPGFEPEVGYYYMKNAYIQDEWAEEGIKFPKEVVDQRVKKIIKDIASVSVHKAGSYFLFKEFENGVIKCNTTDNGSFEVKFSEIDDYEFHYADKYIQASDEKTLQNQKMIEEFNESQKDEKKKNKNKK